MAKTSEARTKITLDSKEFQKSVKEVVAAAESMSNAITRTFTAASVAILGLFGAKTLGAVVNTAKGVLDLGEQMANAGKMANMAAGSFYLFNAAVEKGLSLKTVAGLIGDNANVLSRSAGIFRDAALKLWVVGEKIRGFWLGLMERVTPVLSRILDGALGQSLVSAGQMFGDKIAEAASVIYDLAQDGKLWETFKKGFEIAFDYAGERMKWLGNIGFDILKEVFSTGFVDGVLSGLATLQESIKEFAKGFGEELGNAFYVIWTDIMEAFYGMLNKLGEWAEWLGITEEGTTQASREHTNQKIAEMRKTAAAPTTRPATNQTDGATFMDRVAGVLKNNQFQQSDELASSIFDFQQSLSATLKKATDPANPNNVTASAMTAPVTFENNNRRAAFGADSLTSIGGGGGVYLGLSVLDVQKSQLSELRQISAILGSMAGGQAVTVGAAVATAAATSVSRFQKKSPASN